MPAGRCVCAGRARSSDFAVIVECCTVGILAEEWATNGEDGDGDVSCSLDLFTTADVVCCLIMPKEGGERRGGPRQVYQSSKRHGHVSGGGVGVDMRRPQAGTTHEQAPIERASNGIA